MINNISIDKKYVPSADALSVLPVAQQVVGAGTVLSNVGKLGLDVFNRIGLALDQRSTNKELKAIEAYKKDGDIKVLPRYLRNTIAREQVELHVNALDKALAKNKADRTQHIKYIAIGIIRAIPVVGTIYSIYRLVQKYKIEKAKQNETVETVVKTNLPEENRVPKGQLKQLEAALANRKELPQAYKEHRAIAALKERVPYIAPKNKEAKKTSSPFIYAADQHIRNLPADTASFYRGQEQVVRARIAQLETTGETNRKLTEADRIKYAL